MKKSKVRATLGAERPEQILIALRMLFTLRHVVRLLEDFLAHEHDGLKFRAFSQNSTGSFGTLSCYAKALEDSLKHTRQASEEL